MSAAPIVIQGMVKPDGTLELTEPLPLPPGPVQLTVQVLPPSASQEEWWPCLQRIRAELEAKGYPFLTEEEVQAHIDDLRSGDERIEEIYRQIEEEGRRREQSRC